MKKLLAPLCMVGLLAGGCATAAREGDSKVTAEIFDPSMSENCDGAGMELGRAGYAAIQANGYVYVTAVGTKPGMAYWTCLVSTGGNSFEMRWSAMGSHDTTPGRFKCREAFPASYEVSSITVSDLDGSHSIPVQHP